MSVPVASQSEKSFWSHLIHHILEGRNVPKLQVERAIGPIIGFFLEDIAKALLNDGEPADVAVLAPEFPLLKQGRNLLSTNIDWLIHNKTSAKNELVFFELKTATSSFAEDQLEIYLQWADKVAWPELRASYEVIANGGHEKYVMAKKALFKQEEAIGDAIHHAKVCILYLLPKGSVSAKEKEQWPNVRFFTFSELAARIEQSPRASIHYPDQLFEFCNLLKVLDDAPAPTRRTLNHSGQPLPLSEMMEKANNYRDDIVIGFDGGTDKLHATALSHLEDRMYKWDWVDDRKAEGRKIQKNWIRGQSFLDTMSFLRQDNPTVPVE